ncbi:hypothetical protein ACRC7T_14975 [Segnochrobactraceae bacterium EtOH-i3]
MEWGFQRQAVYNRGRDIHEKFGGQRQGGVITPAKHAVIIIITGDHGAENGYNDRRRPDGQVDYFGEGQLGDMTWARGNKAIRDHVANGKSLLLFRKERAGVRFLGEMACVGHHIERAPDRAGNMRDAIVFELREIEPA